jgi:hypothetical protein
MLVRGVIKYRQARGVGWIDGSEKGRRNRRAKSSIHPASSTESNPISPSFDHLQYSPNEESNGRDKKVKPLRQETGTTAEGKRVSEASARLCLIEGRATTRNRGADVSAERKAHPRD